MRERRDIMRLHIQNGISDIKEIKTRYNSLGDGGDKTDLISKPKYTGSDSVTTNYMVDPEKLRNRAIQDQINRYNGQPQTVDDLPLVRGTREQFNNRRNLATGAAKMVSPEFQLMTAGVGSLATKASTVLGRIGQTALHGGVQGAIANASNLSGSEQNLSGLATDVLGGSITGGVLKGVGLGVEKAYQIADPHIQLYNFQRSIGKLPSASNLSNYDSNSLLEMRNEMLEPAIKRFISSGNDFTAAEDLYDNELIELYKRGISQLDRNRLVYPLTDKRRFPKSSPDVAIDNGILRDLVGTESWSTRPEFTDKLFDKTYSARKYNPELLDMMKKNNVYPYTVAPNELSRSFSRSKKVNNLQEILGSHKSFEKNLTEYFDEGNSKFGKGAPGMGLHLKSDGYRTSGEGNWRGVAPFFSMNSPRPTFYGNYHVSYIPDEDALMINRQSIDKMFPGIRRPDDYQHAVKYSDEMRRLGIDISGGGTGNEAQVYNASKITPTEINLSIKDKQFQNSNIRNLYRYDK